MNLETDDRAALVLGAGGGLGGAIVRMLAEEGAHVVCAHINAQAAAQTAADIVAHSGDAFPISGDLADIANLEANMGRVEGAFGPVDILVNNTGGPPPTPAAGQEPKLWSEHFNAMVISVIAITDHVPPGMKERRWGRISQASEGTLKCHLPRTRSKY